VAIESPKPHFDPAVREALKKSQFAQNCQGEVTEITFEFVVSTTRRSAFRQDVVFVPPSRFQILTDLMELNP